MYRYSSIFLMISIVGHSSGFFDHDHDQHGDWCHHSHEGGFSDSGEGNSHEGGFSDSGEGNSHEGGFSDSGEGNGHSHEFHHNHGGFPDSGEWNKHSHEFHHNHGGFADSGEGNGPPYEFHHYHEGGFHDSGERNGPPYDFHHKPGSGEGNGHTTDFHHNPENENNTYTEILEKFIIANEALKNFCANNSKVKPSISFGRNAYLLKYALKTTDVNVDVIITNKILKTSVTMKNSQNLEVFTDVTVLPDILNFNGANWLISNGELKIRIPYTVPLMTETSVKCGAVNNNVINVPVAALPAFEYRVNTETV